MTIAESWKIRWPLLIFVVLLCGGCLYADAESSKLGTVIGIDIGTTYSSVGVYKDGRVEIIANDRGNKFTPSWIAFTDNETLIGDAAKNQALANAERTIFNVKRIIGRNFTDKVLLGFIDSVPYKIVNKEGKPFIEIKIKEGNTIVLTPQEITAIIITKMKETAEAFLGKEIKDAVITVPAYFNDAQRDATREAGVIAGLHVAEILNEPSAAAIAYSVMDNKSTGAKNLLVYHLGGGTMDVSIIKIENGILKVLATNGHTHLGGEDIDAEVAGHVARMFTIYDGMDIRNNSMALQKLRRECERAKRELSSQYKAWVEVEGFNLSRSLELRTLSNLAGAVMGKTIGRTMGIVNRAMKDAALWKHQIDEIVLVGGSTKSIEVQRRLKEEFRGKDEYKGLNPDEAAVCGAALKGAILSGEAGDEAKDLLLLDIAPPVVPETALDIQRIPEFKGLGKGGIINYGYQGRPSGWSSWVRYPYLAPLSRNHSLLG
ncbi:hypothetical protein ACHQM5_020907 [Ranunculus cassubicifolius]